MCDPVSTYYFTHISKLLSLISKHFWSWPDKTFYGSYFVVCNYFLNCSSLRRFHHPRQIPRNDIKYSETIQQLHPVIKMFRSGNSSNNPLMFRGEIWLMSGHTLFHKIIVKLTFSFPCIRPQNLDLWAHNRINGTNREYFPRGLLKRESGKAAWVSYHRRITWYRSWGLRSMATESRHNGGFATRLILGLESTLLSLPGITHVMHSNVASLRAISNWYRQKTFEI